MSKIPNGEDNPNGLYKRYNISKVNGKPIDNDAEYFVLRLDNGGDDENHINACRKAIVKYADEIAPHMPQLAKDLYDKYEPKFDVYCPVCSGCGEDGCCSARFCQNDRRGYYCESYFQDLKDDKDHLDTWLWFMAKYHKDIYDDFYNRLDELEEEERFEMESKFNRKLNDEGDDYGR